ncbi:MAG: hypothetical protein J6M06_04310 [Synergistaceae bacterium]|nr:hypothetical protein [Synergistaceae bacterium]
MFVFIAISASVLVVVSMGILRRCAELLFFEFETISKKDRKHYRARYLLSLLFCMTCLILFFLICVSFVPFSVRLLGLLRIAPFYLLTFFAAYLSRGSKVKLKEEHKICSIKAAAVSEVICALIFIVNFSLHMMGFVVEVLQSLLH